LAEQNCKNTIYGKPPYDQELLRLMLLRASCDIFLELEDTSALMLMLRARSGASQWIRRDEFFISPKTTVMEYTDGYGNLSQRLLAPKGKFEIHTTIEAETSDFMDETPSAGFVSVQDLPDSVLTFLLPTRYCESDKFPALTLSVIEQTSLGWSQVNRITQWIRENVAYEPDKGETLLTADEVRAQGHGVCRDLAHLGIAMCRSIAIPARLVVGYLHELSPMNLHAWFEAYVGNRWYTFDPSQKALTGGRIAIAYGRDAVDVPVYHLFGALPLYSQMDVKVEQLSD